MSCNLYRKFSYLSNEKLFYVNNIELPKDIVNIIKEYLFIEQNDAMIIHFIQHKKKIVNGLIEMAVSRNNSRGIWSNIETNPHWMFGFVGENFYLDSALQLQGVNCPKCGEYKFISYDTFPNVNPNIKLCDCLTDYTEYTDGELESYPYGNYEYSSDIYESDTDESIS